MSRNYISIILFLFCYILHVLLYNDTIGQSKFISFIKKDQYHQGSRKLVKRLNCRTLFEDIFTDPFDQLLKYYLIKNNMIKDIKLKKSFNFKVIIDEDFKNLNDCRVSRPLDNLNFNDSLLHAAVLANRINLVKILVSANVNINVKVEGYKDDVIIGDVNGYYGVLDGMTPLHYTSLMQTVESVKIAEFLLKNGANPNARDIYSRTPLHTLGLVNNLNNNALFKILIKYNADSLALDKFGYSPMFTAISRDNVKLTLKYLNSKDNKDNELIEKVDNIDWNLPLHISALFNVYEVGYYFHKESLILQRNIYGKSPLDYAIAPLGDATIERKNIVSSNLNFFYSSVEIGESFKTLLVNALLKSIEYGFSAIVESILYLQFNKHYLINIDRILERATRKATKYNQMDILSSLKILSKSRYCPKPPSVKFSKYELSDTVIGNVIIVGDTIKYTCYEGFKTVGNSLITCTMVDDKLIYIPNIPYCVKKIQKVEIPNKYEHKTLPHFNSFNYLMIIAILIIACLVACAAK